MQPEAVVRGRREQNACCRCSEA